MTAPKQTFPINLAMGFPSEGIGELRGRLTGFRAALCRALSE